MKETNKVTRKYILDSAADIVLQDRENMYGSPENSFEMISDLWSAYLDTSISPHDVGIMMVLLKISRIRTGTFNPDSYIDIAGYAACAGEIIGSNNYYAFEKPNSEESEDDDSSKLEDSHIDNLNRVLFNDDLLIDVIDKIIISDKFKLLENKGECNE